VPAEAKTWLDERPPACEAQADWILERLAKGEDPRSHPDLDLKAPDFGEVLKLLWKKKLIDDGTLSLSATGRTQIERLLLVHHRGLPGPSPFKVHVGPIGSGNKVVHALARHDAFRSVAMVSFATAVTLGAGALGLVILGPKRVKGRVKNAGLGSAIVFAW
jgi:hypothetical protein